MVKGTRSHILPVSGHTNMCVFYLRIAHMQAYKNVNSFYEFIIEILVVTYSSIYSSIPTV